jgi:hypothetical protein
MENDILNEVLKFPVDFECDQIPKAWSCTEPDLLRMLRCNGILMSNVFRKLQFPKSPLLSYRKSDLVPEITSYVAIDASEEGEDSNSGTNESTLHCLMIGIPLGEAARTPVQCELAHP